MDFCVSEKKLFRINVWVLLKVKKNVFSVLDILGVINIKF